MPAFNQIPHHEQRVGMVCNSLCTSLSEPFDVYQCAKLARAPPDQSPVTITESRRAVQVTSNRNDQKGPKRPARNSIFQGKGEEETFPREAGHRASGQVFVRGKTTGRSHALN